MGEGGAGSQCRVSYLGGIQLGCVERDYGVGGANTKATQHGEGHDPGGAAGGNSKDKQQGHAGPQEQEHGGEATARKAQHYHRDEIGGYIHKTGAYNV